MGTMVLMRCEIRKTKTHYKYNGFLLSRQQKKEKKQKTLEIIGFRKF